MVRRLHLLLLAMAMLAACSPKFNWRDVHDPDAAYRVQMPDKPATMRRPVQLGSQTVSMQMTGAQVDGVRFAVGAAQLPDATQAQANLAVIRDNLLRNMDGQLRSQKSSVVKSGATISFIEQFQAGSSTLSMQAKLVAHGSWVYEVLVAGPPSALNQEAVETFLASFEPL